MKLTGHQRLFFALAPDDGVRTKLAHLATGAHHALNDSHARVVDTSNLHLTLAFLGEVADDVASDLSTFGPGLRKRRARSPNSLKRSTTARHTRD